MGHLSRASGQPEPGCLVSPPLSLSQGAQPTGAPGERHKLSPLHTPFPARLCSPVSSALPGSDLSALNEVAFWLLRGSENCSGPPATDGPGNMVKGSMVPSWAQLSVGLKG